MDAIVDPDLSLRRKLRALARPVDGADFLARRVVDDLEERLSTISRRFGDAAIIAPPGDEAAENLFASGKIDQLTEIALHPRLAKGADAPAIVNETLPLAPASLDLVVSLLALHEAADLPGQLIQMRRALRPDGLMLAAFPGADTLTELRESLLAAETELSGGASPRVMPFADVRDAGGLLQRAGFALPVADLETVTVRYGSMFGLMRDLRGMGATNALLARSRRPARRGLFLRAAEIYAERFADPDGRIRATFSIIWLSGWAPDASQQKPARRGSANASLADALKKADDDGE